jgi:hypothetical protein
MIGPESIAATLDVFMESTLAAESPEQDMRRLLEYVRTHPEQRQEMASYFVEAVQGRRRADLQAVAFCMHELRWPEVLAAARQVNAQPHPRTMNLVAHVIGAFEDDWSLREVYDYYRER